MTSRPRAGMLPLLGVVVASAGCWRTNVDAITGEPPSDGSASGGSSGSGGSSATGGSSGGSSGSGASGSASDASDGSSVDLGPDAQSCPSPALRAGNTSQTVTMGTLTRSYTLHVPTSYDGKKPVPLILDFHGVGGSGTSEANESPYPAVTDREGVVMAFPDGLPGPAGTAWNVGPCCVADVDDVAFAKAVVADIQKTACIDADRVYAVGVLTGGGMAYYLACQAADVFAAVAPAAFDLLAQNVDDCVPSRPITEISFRGTAPSRVPYAGGDSSLVPRMPITFLGAVATFEKWAQIDGCTGSASAKDGNGCSAYSGCERGVEVILCTKQGGGEDPGDPAIAWPVLKRHTR
jgi:polyhydroxybutyrate depolymerase